MNIKYLTKSGRLIEAKKAKPSAHRENLRTLEKNLELKSLLEKFALEEIEKFICEFEKMAIHTCTLGRLPLKCANRPIYLKIHFTMD